jgi:site-specific DNA-cytosine methylase
VEPGFGASRKRMTCQGTRSTTVPMVACPQPLHPKLAQRRPLPDVVRGCLDALSSNELESLASAWGLRAGTHRVITIGTGCSGSELYLLSLQHLAAGLTALTGCDVSFQHVWACELSPRKRDWIRANFKPEHLFRDLKEVATGEAWDVAAGEGEAHRRLVPVPAVDILIAGFSCKDASALNVHRASRLDAVQTGAGTTGSTFQAFVKLLGGMTPRPRFCLLENVPGLAQKDKTTGRSNLDAVHDAFHAHDYAFVFKKFNASDTGLPNKRPRLYMAAVAGLPALAAESDLTERVHGSLQAILSVLTPKPIDEFLLDAYMPEGYSNEDMITEWMHEMRTPRRRRLVTPDPKLAGRKAPGGHSGMRMKLKRPAARSRKPPHTHKAAQTWAACPHAGDKSQYLADLEGNPWFRLLTGREQDVLLLHLCQHPHPGLQDGVVTVMSSAKYSRICRGAFPCQVPNAKFWILGRSRLQTGADALMLQGVDLVDIPSFASGSHRRWSSAFLQDLAGNAFCVYQFVVWLLACLPHVPCGDQ